VDLDRLDLERGGPLLIREQGAVVVVPPASEFTWQQVAMAIMDARYFGVYIWPQEYPLRFGWIDYAQQSWCRHNGLTDLAETRQLVHMAGRYFEGIEWDLRTRCGISAGELWRERRWRELYSYIKQLPSDSRVNHLIANDEEYLEKALANQDKNRTPGQSGPSGPSMAEWNLTNALLTKLVNAVRQNTEVTKAAAGGKAGNIQPERGPVTAADKVLNRLRQREHEEMSAILLRNRPSKAGTILGTPSPAE
jgi:hypothetical protein